MSQLSKNTASLEVILEAVNALPEAANYNTVYVSATEPDAAIGNEGDLYLVLEV